MTRRGERGEKQVGATLPFIATPDQIIGGSVQHTSVSGKKGRCQGNIVLLTLVIGPGDRERAMATQESRRASPGFQIVQQPGEPLYTVEQEALALLFAPRFIPLPWIWSWAHELPRFAQVDALG
jgi:hypothetical protein